MKNYNNKETTFTTEQEKDFVEIMEEYDIVRDEYSTPYDVTKEIKSREKLQFFAECREAKDEKEVYNLTKLFAKKIFPLLPEKAQEACKENRNLWIKVNLNLYACGLSAYSMMQAETWKEYMMGYALFKSTTYLKLHDYGAFGDVVETCFHLLVRRNEWRVNIKTLHVSAIGKTDITINGVKFECGINGKSWTDSTYDNPMNGKYSSVLYGCFTDEEREAICKKLIHGEFAIALKEIAKSVYVFTNKNDYLNFMNGISRSDSIVWKKQGYYQTVYNGSKHNAFCKAIENSCFPNFLEFFGHTDFYSLTD